jgi:hypothetical protein
VAEEVRGIDLSPDGAADTLAELPFTKAVERDGQLALDVAAERRSER